MPCRNDTTLQHGWLATPIARAAAEAAGVDAVVVELAARHADGARGANGAAEARGDATLAQLVLVGDLAAEAAAHERSADEADDTHHAVVRVRNTIDGVALATYLAAEAKVRVEALGDVAEAAEGGIHVGHGEET